MGLRLLGWGEAELKLDVTLASLLPALTPGLAAGPSLPCRSQSGSSVPDTDGFHRLAWVTDVPGAWGTSPTLLMGLSKAPTWARSELSCPSPQGEGESGGSSPGTGSFHACFRGLHAGVWVAGSGLGGCYQQQHRPCPCSLHTVAQAIGIVSESGGEAGRNADLHSCQRPAWEPGQE